MSILTGALAMGRHFAETMMTDTCHITRTHGTTVNPDTLTIGETTTNIYEGVCRLTMSANQVRDAESASRILLEQSLTLHLPVETSTAVDPGDTIEIITAESDPSLTGRTFRISGTHHQSQATARRFPITEVTQ